jgi:Spy/CpxP family protein refolding chaperone
MKPPIRKSISLMVVGVLLSALALQTFADTHRLDRLTQRLNLTAEQQSAMEGLHEQMEPNRQARNEARQEIRSLIASDQVDAAAALAADAARERTYRMAERRQAMAEILTPEQLQQLEEMRQRRGEKRQGRGRRDR